MAGHERLDGVMDANFRFSADTAELDREQVHRWISEQSYWAAGRSRSAQDAAIDASRNFGVYEANSNRQVAYGRVVTDGVTLAWLCDVFVEPAVRGRGVGTALIAGIVTECESLGVRRIALTTNDAHGLYSKFGFRNLDNVEMWMERLAHVPDRS